MLGNAFLLFLAYCSLRLYKFEIRISKHHHQPQSTTSKALCYGGEIPQFDSRKQRETPIHDLSFLLSFPLLKAGSVRVLLPLLFCVIPFPVW